MTAAIGFQTERDLQGDIRKHSRAEHWPHALQAHPLLRRLKISRSFFAQDYFVFLTSRLGH